MMSLKWSSKYSMGSKLIDGHHQTLIDCINDLDRAIEKKETDAAYLEKLAKKLEAYTQYHFQLEEDYMSRYQYPEIAAHKEEHEAFIAAVRKIKEAVTRDPQIDGLKLTSYLKTWLIHHILLIDKEYAIWFQEQGIRLV